MFIFLLVIAGCSSSSSNNNKKTDQLNENVTASLDSFLSLDAHEYTLDNGLKVLLIPNKKLPIFSYYTFFDVGAKYEKDGMTGSTHFLEHLMFHGSKNFPRGVFDSAIESHGGHTNAFTSQELTVYYNSLPSDFIDELIEMEADRMQQLSFEKDGFEKERQVVIEEKRVNYDNDPQGKLHLALTETMFKGTPYEISTIGKQVDIESVSLEQIKNYYHTFYAPNNALLVIVGDINPEETFAMIKKQFGPLKAAPNLEKAKEFKKDFEVNNAKRKSWVKINGSAPTPIFRLAYPGYKLGEREAYVADILSQILGGGESSYLVQKYVNTRWPRLSYIYSVNLNYQKTGMFYIGGELLRKVNLPRMRRNLRRDLKRACSSKIINGRSVQKAKNQFWVEFFRNLQTNSGLARFVGMHEMLMGDYKNYEKEIDIYKSIEAQEVMKLCKNLFYNQKPSFLSLWQRHAKNR